MAFQAQLPHTKPEDLDEHVERYQQMADEQLVVLDHFHHYVTPLREAVMQRIQSPPSQRSAPPSVSGVVTSTPVRTTADRRQERPDPVTTAEAMAMAHASAGISAESGDNADVDLDEQTPLHPEPQSVQASTVDDISSADNTIINAHGRLPPPLEPQVVLEKVTDPNQKTPEGSQKVSSKHSKIASKNRKSSTNGTKSSSSSTSSRTRAKIADHAARIELDALLEAQNAEREAANVERQAAEAAREAERAAADAERKAGDERAECYHGGPQPPTTWRSTNTVAKPAAMKARVATSERGESRASPQTPWPLVQPAQ